MDWKIKFRKSSKGQEKKKNTKEKKKTQKTSCKTKQNKKRGLVQRCNV